MEHIHKTVLVIEDDKSLSRILNDSFTEKGFSVKLAYDGEEGLSVALESHPDLILLDVLMPKMDGMAMLKKLRQDPWGKTVPVMMLTNLNDSQKAVEAVQYDVHDYLVKAQWSLENIAGKIKTRLGLS